MFGAKQLSLNRDTESVVALTPNVGLNYILNTKCITERNNTKYPTTMPVQSHCFLDLGNHGTAMNHRASKCTQTIDFAQRGQSEYRSTATPSI